MKRILYSLLIAAVILPGATAHLQARDRKPKTSKTVQAAEPVRNVILMIGDGMGLAQVTSYMLRGGAPLSLARAQSIGLQSTFSASSEVTDSAAAATALATGTKTNNGMISMTPDKQPLRSVLERAAAAGLATGLVDTHAITDATPVAFIGHNESRKNEDDLAADFLRTDIDLFIGGGRDHFEKRSDGRNISDELREKGYTVAYSLDTLAALDKSPVGILLADKSLPLVSQGRGDMLPRATDQALRLLSANGDKGFFVMIEGSHIDNGGHDNNAETVLSEIRDFDAAVKIALDFADRTPGTLVIITGDHETGGMTLPSDENKFDMGKLQPGDKNRATVHDQRTHGVPDPCLRLRRGCGTVQRFHGQHRYPETNRRSTTSGISQNSRRRNNIHSPDIRHKAEGADDPLLFVFLRHASPCRCYNPQY